MSSIRFVTELLCVIVFQMAAGFSFTLMLDAAFEGDWPRFWRWSVAWCLFLGVTLWVFYFSIKGGCV